MSELLENVVEAIERAAVLAGQMLAYSGGGRSFARGTALNDIVQAEIDEARLEVKREIEIDSELADDLPLICANRAHGGAFVVESEVAKATTIRALFPVRESAPGDGTSPCA